MPNKTYPDSIRTLLIGAQTAEGTLASTFVNLRAITSFEPQYSDSYEIPRFENGSGWGEEDAYGTTSTRGMRISAWLETNDLGWFLGSVMRCADVLTGSGPTYTHTFTAVDLPFSANPYFSLGWTDGTNDATNATVYQFMDCRCTQLVLAWDFMANSWRATMTVEGRPNVDTDLVVQADAAVTRANILGRTRTGKIILPKHTAFQRGSISSGTNYPLISGNITLNNQAATIYGSTTGSDPDGTEYDLVVPLRREDGNMSGRYDLTYDKALFKAANSVTPFDDYITGNPEIWRILAWGQGGAQKLEMILPYGKAISGNPNLAGQRSTRETVQGMIGLNTGTASYPFKAILVNTRSTAYYS